MELLCCSISQRISRNGGRECLCCSPSSGISSTLCTEPPGFSKHSRHPVMTTHNGCTIMGLPVDVRASSFALVSLMLPDSTLMGPYTLSLNLDYLFVACSCDAITGRERALKRLTAAKRRKGLACGGGASWDSTTGCEDVSSWLSICMEYIAKLPDCSIVENLKSTWMSSNSACIACKTPAFMQALGR